MTTVGNIIHKIEQFAPKHLAEDWDPIGLAFGSNDKKVKKMMVALDLDANVLSEAKEKEVDFIFTHHPPIFKSLKVLNEHDQRVKEYIELIQSDISLYAAHTNLDNADGGMNDWLANALSLQGPYDSIKTSYVSNYKKLSFYAPSSHTNSIRHALHEIGLGEVGDYTNVSYTSKGIGRFKPNQSANPYLGSRGQIEEVKEERVEIYIPVKLIGKAIEKLYKEHPYEEPVYSISDSGFMESKFGLGRVGELKRPKKISDIAADVKEKFNLDSVRLANINLDQKVSRIAILGGSGEGYYKDALNKGAELFITGDVSYHGAQDMIRDGLPFIDPGHFIENIFVEEMTEKLKKWNATEKWDIEVLSSEFQKDVFKFE